jgi:hypothetical protein
MIFDRYSPFSWSHCKRYCIDRPVVDPHLVYSTFVHKVNMFVHPGSFDEQSIIANTAVYHFQQLYFDRSLEPSSGGCGDPKIVDDSDPSHCFVNYCFQDLSYIQKFLMKEFNVSAFHVAVMSKELNASVHFPRTIAQDLIADAAV